MSPMSLQPGPETAALLAAGLPTPFVVVDLDVVGDRYRSLAAALPGVAVHYAVKANPDPAVLARLVSEGSSFDVASWGEVEQCLDAGAAPSSISFGNTVKRRDVVARAHEAGIRQFAFDSRAELEKLAAVAPGSVAVCRIRCDGAGAAWPLSNKFGCAADEAVELLRAAAASGLELGLSFHVGSQQCDPGAWGPALADVAMVVEKLGTDGLDLSVLNLGGGFGASYVDSEAPDADTYGRSIRRELERWLGGAVPPMLVAEPGRYLVADAGVIQSEVLLVSRRGEGAGRWVYLDVGVFTGLFEAVGEAIRHRVRTPHDGGPSEPAVLAGPTCDSVDVLAEEHRVDLPLALAEGDRVELLGAGAYTTTYSTVGFNGFAPLASHTVGSPTSPSSSAA